MDGSIQEGTFNPSGKLEGTGKIISSDGTIYEGNFKDGKLQTEI